MRLLSLPRFLLNTAIEIIYPPSCVVCEAATLDANQLCAGCWSRLSFITRPFCERFGTPFTLDLGAPLLSPAAIADPPVFQRARAVALYDDIARLMVHKLKYGDRLELAVPMARLMKQAGAELLADADVIVPVPLHRWRLWERRFNQSMMLAKNIANESHQHCDPSLLLRVKYTKSQVGLTKAQRQQNLQGAFKVPDHARIFIENKRILLVDDVLTTHSTANAAARSLLKAGAKSVDVLAFARVVVDG
jgi:ComF family protein